MNRLSRFSSQITSLALDRRKPQWRFKTPKGLDFRQDRACPCAPAFPQREEGESGSEQSNKRDIDNRFLGFALLPAPWALGVAVQVSDNGNGGDVTVNTSLLIVPARGVVGGFSGRPSLQRRSTRCETGCERRQIRSHCRSRAGHGFSEQQLRHQQ